MTGKKCLLLAALGGALMALSFPPVPVFFLAFAAIVPILLVFGREERPKHTFAILYLTFFIFHAGTNWWIGSWQAETDPYLTMSAVALSIVHPFFFIVPFWAYFIAARKLGSGRALWLFPFMWTAFEWLHSLSDFSYPWLTLGNTQAMNHTWIQFIDITGVWGASFLVVLANVVLARLIFQYSGPAAGTKLKKAVLAAAWFLIILGPMAYGAAVMPKYSHESLMASGRKKLAVGLVQPAVNPWRKWEGGGYEQINRHVAIQDSLRKAAGNMDLVIWCETAVPYIGYAINSAHDLAAVQQWLDSTGTALLTGFSEVYFFKPGEVRTKTSKKLGNSDVYYESYNSALLLNPGPEHYRNAQIYYKSRLTPFAERFPFAEHLTFAVNWMKWGVGISSWGKGPGASSLTICRGRDSVRIGSIICIESVYPEFVTDFVKDGAEVLSVITNDAWYDHTPGPEQHYLIATVRAVENRRYVARCANTGVTGFIAPDGTSVKRAREYERTGIMAEVACLGEMTFYTRHGAWLCYVCLAVALLSIIVPKKIFAYDSVK